MAAATSSPAVKIVRCCCGLPALPRLSKRVHACLLEQNLSGDAETSIQAPNHRQGERALAIEHVGHMAAEIRFQILHAKAPLLHAKLDRLDGIWGINWVMRGLIDLDQGD